MRPLRRLFCIALFGLAAVQPFASAAEPQNGSQYLTLPSPQPTDTGKKVEVIEFFAYYCPHCYAFEPQLAAWVRKQGDNIVFKRVHVSAGASALPQQRLFYTLEAMGLLDQYHQKVFDAMHVQRLRLGSDEQVMEWAAQNGIDRARFAEAYSSFGIQAKLRRAEALMAAYKVDHWPMLVVDGRYVTSPSRVHQGDTEMQQQLATLQVMDWLVDKAKAEKR
jgi:thiol:disulfide interchange protein DsbA